MPGNRPITSPSLCRATKHASSPKVRGLSRLCDEERVECVFDSPEAAVTR